MIYVPFFKKNTCNLLVLILFFQANKALAGTMVALGAVVAGGIIAEFCSKKKDK